MKSAEIVLVKFPFSDLESSKKRPALVLNVTNVSSDIQLVTIAMITSRTEGIKLSGDFKVKKWDEAGLLYPSLIRLSKIATVESSLIDKSLGKLNLVDIRSIKKIFKTYFRYWI